MPLLVLALLVATCAPAPAPAPPSPSGPFAFDGDFACEPGGARDWCFVSPRKDTLMLGPSAVCNGPSARAGVWCRQADHSDAFEIIDAWVFGRSASGVRSLARNCAEGWANPLPDCDPVYDPDARPPTPLGWGIVDEPAFFGRYTSPYMIGDDPFLEVGRRYIAKLEDGRSILVQIRDTPSPVMARLRSGRSVEVFGRVTWAYLIESLCAVDFC